jgi:hypothetical protein
VTNMCQNLLKNAGIVPLPQRIRVKNLGTNCGQNRLKRLSLSDSG